MKFLKIFVVIVSLTCSLLIPQSALAQDNQDSDITDSLSVASFGESVILDGESLDIPIGVEFLDPVAGTWSPSDEGFTYNSQYFAIHATQEYFGSAKFAIEINSPNAPQTFAFRFKQGNGYLMPKLNSYGAIDLFNFENKPVAFVLPPWAYDASSSPVPTHFEVLGDVLTQVVNFKGGNFAFPITADPYLGSDLISNVTATLVSGNYNIKIAVTPYLGNLYFQYPTNYLFFGVLYAAASHTYAVYLVQTFGWDEVLSKLSVKYSTQFRGYVYAKTTFKNQFDCHALGAPVVFLSTVAGFDNSPTWDLEGFRAPSTDYTVWVATHCNW